MKCPKCNSEKIVPINQDEQYLYCPSCNHSWKEGKEKQSLEEKGTLDFKGVPAAKEIFEFLTGENSNMTPEMRSALETQLVGVIFEQWFQGFKAGQLANIVHVRSYYDGETRNEPNSTVRQHEKGTNNSRKETDIREDSFSRKPNINASGGNQTIRERIAGITFEYPRHIKVPENIYTQAAEVSCKLAGEVFKFRYDGRVLIIEVKTGK